VAYTVSSLGAIFSVRVGRAELDELEDEDELLALLELVGWHPATPRVATSANKEKGFNDFIRFLLLRMIMILVV
jgi:hypothetical protein